MNHAREVFQEAKEYDEVFDCQMVTAAKANKDILCNPIYSFTDEDVWRYIEENSIETNPLYKMGYARVGCIGCPMATTKIREKEFIDFPQYKQNYIKAFDKMLIARKESGKQNIDYWTTGQDVFDWWMEYYKYYPKGQMTIDEWIEEK